MSLPDHALIIGDDGLPLSVLDIDKMQSDSTRLMYQMAAAAGDRDELDRIGAEWAGSHDPDYFGYVAAGALSLMVRCVLEPVLEVLDGVMPAARFREKLAESRDHAEGTLS